MLASLETTVSFSRSKPESSKADIQTSDLLFNPFSSLFFPFLFFLSFSFPSLPLLLSFPSFPPLLIFSLFLSFLSLLFLSSLTSSFRFSLLLCYPFFPVNRHFYAQRLVKMIYKNVHIFRNLIPLFVLMYFNLSSPPEKLLSARLWPY